MNMLPSIQIINNTDDILEKLISSITDDINYGFKILIKYPILNEILYPPDIAKLIYEYTHDIIIISYIIRNNSHGIIIPFHIRGYNNFNMINCKCMLYTYTYHNKIRYEYWYYHPFFNKCTK